MSERYMKYIPLVLEDYTEINTLADLEDVFLEEMEDAKSEIFENQWITTSRESGLKRLATIMNLTETYETIEDLRELVLLYWNSNQDYTYYYLLDFLDVFCGEDAYTVDMQYENYFLKVVLALSVKEKQTTLQKKLREWIPANLDCMVYLDTNTYGIIGNMTHSQLNLSGITIGELPYEDLELYIS
ncbi:putative phage tail protein [Chakrabartyella piscis]|uniref:putative phage tail protein n=1 Tax=Chakrabartyella piscis TaxID=2918914 RepID=UPI002958584B|nr:putative phage tail protein [Chakrabartyella piscis]